MDIKVNILLAFYMDPQIQYPRTEESKGSFFVYKDIFAPLRKVCGIYELERAINVLHGMMEYDEKT